MWTNVAKSDYDTLEQCGAMMRAVDKAYHGFSAATIGYYMLVEAMRVYYFQSNDEGNDGRIVLLIRRDKRHNNWRVWTMGIAGSQPVSWYVETTSAFLVSFMRREHIDSMRGIIRLKLENDAMNEFYRQAVMCSDLVFVEQHHMGDQVAYDVSVAQGAELTGGRDFHLDVASASASSTS